MYTLLDASTLFSSIGMVVIDYTVHVLHLSVIIANPLGCYLKDLKFLIIILTLFLHKHVTYIILKIRLNIQVCSSNMTLSHLYACWHMLMYFLELINLY